MSVTGAHHYSRTLAEGESYPCKPNGLPKCVHFETCAKLARCCPAFRAYGAQRGWLDAKRRPDMDLAVWLRTLPDRPPTSKRSLEDAQRRMKAALAKLLTLPVHENRMALIRALGISDTTFGKYRTHCEEFNAAARERMATTNSSLHKPPG